MLQTLKNAWHTKEIKSKILFTLLILLLYRIGTVIPVPFVDAHNFAGQFGGTILGYMNTLSGGALGQATLFALGVSPYINASIIIQLLAVAFPKLGELSKDESGKKVMSMITRITTVVLALVTAIGYYFLLKNGDGKNSALSNLATESSVPWLFAIVIIACYCAGASLIMWLAERINDKGIGNGISLILFANIVSELPSKIYYLVLFVISSFNTEDPVVVRVIGAFLFAFFLIAVTVAITVFVIWVTGSERRIPVQYAKKVVGRKMYGGQSSNLPIKLNMTGVMPVIFASSIVSLLPTILALCGVKSVASAGASKANFWNHLYDFLGADGWFYPLIFGIMIIGFTYFYTQITFNPVEVANNLQQNGGAVPGIRPGRPTVAYITKILNRITLLGALFLIVLSGVPMIVNAVWYSIDGYGLSELAFSGSSLLIVVGVALETFRELEAQMTLRNYKGFLD